jgi:hypothetical protein
LGGILLVIVLMISLGELLAAATSSARDMNDLELAARLGRAALKAGAGPRTGLLVGEALLFRGLHDEAEDLLAEQAARCESDSDRAAIARARFYNLGTLIGDLERATLWADEALAVIRNVCAKKTGLPDW